jgi:hypothetical protein
MILRTILTISLALSGSLTAYAAAPPQEAALNQCAKDWFKAGTYSTIAPGLKVVNSDSNVPWSEAVILRDDFSGKESVTIRDHHYVRPAQFTSVSYQEGVLSVWGVASIGFKAYRQRNTTTISFPVFEATAKVDGTLFVLTRADTGYFDISPELAEALSKSDDLTMRVKLDNGSLVTYPIGKGTVTEWRNVRETLRLSCKEPAMAL